jgi:hypothetical protein
MRIIVCVAVGAVCLAIFLPYILSPRDAYVMLGTISTKGIHNFRCGRDGVLVNVITEPVSSVKEFRIAGLIRLRSKNYNHEQNLASSNFARGLVKTNWFYMRPSPVNCPSGEELEITIQIEEEVSVPFQLIVRYRTYGIPLH